MTLEVVNSGFSCGSRELYGGGSFSTSLVETLDFSCSRNLCEGCSGVENFACSTVGASIVARTCNVFSLTPVCCRSEDGRLVWTDITI